MGTIWEIGFGTFLLITVILGGGAAYLTGRAVALTWRPALQLIVYTAGLTFSVRFIHYALFGGTLLSVQYAIVDFLVLFAFAGVGFRITRAGQMAGQYSWLYQRLNPFFWRRRPESGPTPRP
jgi:hypothetical protein